MGFGQNHGAGDASRLPLIGTEAMEQLPDHGDTVPAAGADAEFGQPHGVEQLPGWAAAVLEIGNQVETVHAFILLRFT